MQFLIVSQIIETLNFFRATNFYSNSEFVLLIIRKEGNTHFEDEPRCLLITC